MKNNKILLRSQKSLEQKHKIYFLRVNKILLSSNDDKILQIFDGNASYLFSTRARKGWETELWEYLKSDDDVNFDDLTGETNIQSKLAAH